jgi:hypothetical protein
VTPHLPVRAVLGLSRALVAVCFPLTRFLSRIPIVRQINRLVPIAAVHATQLSREEQYVWTLLDTFDWYGARYEKRQDHAHVMGLLRDVGLVEVDGGPGLARGRRPARSAKAR